MLINYKPIILFRRSLSIFSSSSFLCPNLARRGEGKRSPEIQISLNMLTKGFMSPLGRANIGNSQKRYQSDRNSKASKFKWVHRCVYVFWSHQRYCSFSQGTSKDFWHFERMNYYRLPRLLFRSYDVYLCYCRVVRLILLHQNLVHQEILKAEQASIGFGSWKGWLGMLLLGGLAARWL